MSQPYRIELDGIRAIAVGAVILAHAGAPLPGGHLGVDMFFVLSGYLITGHILRDLAAGRFSLTDFYIRRARRILPALILVTIACLPAAWILLPPERMEQFGQALVALILFASNFLFWLQSGYFAPAAAENPLIHTWSLAVEEQFYLAFPLLMLVLWARARARIGWVLAALGLASLAAFAHVWGEELDTAFYLLPFRAWELMAGALTAWVCHHRTPWGDARMAALGLVLVICALVLGGADPVQGWVWSLAAAGGTVLLLLYARPDTWVACWLSLPPLRALGLISYSAYLWHQPVLAFGRLGQIEPLSTVQLAGLVGLTLLLAWASWAWVEQPFRRRPVPRVRGVVLAGGAAIGLAGLGLAADLSGGFAKARFSPAQLQLYASAQPSPARDRCHGSATRVRACTYGAAVPPGWAVIGDSHAVEVAYALGEALGSRGEAVLHLSASACPPLLRGDHPCAVWMDRALARLDAEPGIRRVVLVWRHGLYAPAEGTDPSATEVYLAPVETLARALRDDGRDVVVLAPVPELPRHVDLLVRDQRGGDVMSISRAAHERRYRALDTAMERLPAHLLDPAEALCDRSRCYAGHGRESAADAGGEAFYFDDDHLSLAGARRVIAPLLDRRRAPWSDPRLVEDVEDRVR